ncbi:hypothetical protein [uncultured Sphingomonas sp.]|uniref:hypothetical protein n=1 Tax=uncultured Sphingomonas sp. TaxID=158754 RepID=UPI0025E86167|nr:hypothetical protein [uncultured Sphingomonas sp.]
MRYQQFIEQLAQKRPSPRVHIEDLVSLVHDYHHGVGRVFFRYFDHFPGSQYGIFFWMEEELAGRNEEPHRDAQIHLSSVLRDDRPLRRIVAAKEMMHVFDEEKQRTANVEQLRTLLNDIAEKPFLDEASAQYAADREALWKAIIALVPPWLRQEYLDQARAGVIKPAELAARWWLPENVAAAVVGSQYETAAARFGIDIQALSVAA